MYLKSLQLVGFKSFAEKTSLEFIPGVTAIVGPNGCGKSNVADAIRWVLGEQSAKALRGAEMADVIFSGTDGRKAIGMAEVSMTFADVDPKSISLPGVNLEFNEISISRRVYRDGNGEYFINKTPCRLRDIQNMFMDTGIGRSSYSLMAQGQIDQILSAHPEDRRNTGADEQHRDEWEIRLRERGIGICVGICPDGEEGRIAKVEQPGQTDDDIQAHRQQHEDPGVGERIEPGLLALDPR